MKGLNALDWTALILLIIGGLNWGLVGLFDYNLVNAIFGGIAWLESLIYILVGLSAVYVASIIPSLQRYRQHNVAS